MEWKKNFNLSFYILIPCFILATLMDFFVSYTVFYYDPSHFISYELNKIFIMLFTVDVKLAAVFLIILTGIILWMLFFLKRMTLFCLKYDEKRVALFSGISTVSILFFGIVFHIIGALRWTVYVPLPFID